jgi:hypothetical protein
MLALDLMKLRLPCGHVVRHEQHILTSAGFVSSTSHLQDSRVIELTYVNVGVQNLVLKLAEHAGKEGMAWGGSEHVLRPLPLKQLHV